VVPPGWERKRLSTSPDDAEDTEITELTQETVMKWHSPRTYVMTGTVLLLVVAGCTDDPDPSPGASAPPSPATASDVVTRSLQDIERYWTATFPTISNGEPFKPVQGGYHPYTQTDPPPSCGGEPGVYQPNAFYCPTGDYIAWDSETLIPQLRTDFGELLVGVVMAHEYGHAIQARLGVTDQPTVVLEQQADCFAGAWLADALADRSTAFKDIAPAQLDRTIAGVLLLRDRPGTSATAPEAHGNAFDRIRALQDGVQNGATKCTGYRADNLPVTEVLNHIQTSHEQDAKILIEPKRRSSDLCVSLATCGRAAPRFVNWCRWRLTGRCLALSRLYCSTIHASRLSSATASCRTCWNISNEA